MDAVHGLLQEKSVRDLTMEEVAKRAGVGKPTLYKWWPTKASLVLTMFQERIAGRLDAPAAATTEEFLRGRVRNVIREFNGLFGKVVADLIAEGQSEPEILRELQARHLGPRRAASVAEVEKAKAAGELSGDVDAGLLIDSIFGSIYFRLLVRHAPLTEQFGQELVDQVLRGSKVVHELQEPIVQPRP